MKIRLTSRNVYSAHLYQGDRVYGRRLLSQGILVIIDSKYPGQLAVPRWPYIFWAEGEGELRYLRLTHLYLVFRQCLEILGGYGFRFDAGEKAKLRTVIEVAQSLNLALVGKDTGDTERLSQMLVECRQSIYLALGKARKPVKVEALLKAGKLGELYDSLGRVNLAARRAQALAVKGRAQQRLWGEIAQIEPVIVARLWASSTALDYAESTVVTSRQAILEIGRYLRRTARVTPRKREELASRLALETASLEAIDFQPFVGNFRLCHAELEQAIVFLRRGNVPSALENMGKAYFSLSYKEVQRLIEEIILDLTLSLMDKGDRHQAAGEALRRLAKAEREVTLIKEKGFRRPVKPKVQLFLEASRNALEAEKLEEAKNKLKLASQVVTADWRS